MKYVAIISLVFSFHAYATERIVINTLSPRGDILDEYERVQPKAEKILRNAKAKLDSQLGEATANVKQALEQLHNKEYKNAIELLSGYNDHDLLAYKFLLYRIVV